MLSYGTSFNDLNAWFYQLWLTRDSRVIPELTLVFYQHLISG